MKPGTILGPGGRPVRSARPGGIGREQSYFLYPSPRWNLKQYKPRYWLGADIKDNVSEYDRSELVNYSRQLFAQIGNLSTAIKQKNSWAFSDAWHPHYTGQNKAWGEEAGEFLRHQFYPMCNLRGPQYDLRRSMTISGQMWDIDGDDVMVLSESANGFPMVGFFPSTRIGLASSRGLARKDADTVSGGPYSGARVFDGIVMDRQNRMIAVQLSSEDGVTYVPSYSCDLSYLPDWHDQGRGIPRIATCLLRWMDLQDIDDFLRRGMKRAASVGLKFKTESGEAAVGNEIVIEADLPASTEQRVSGSEPKVAYEEIEGGEVYYLSANTGEEIEQLEYENPHPNSEAFVERVTRESVASVGWLYELLDLTQTGRAPTRLACDIANQSIWEQQSPARRRWKRMISYAIAKGMKNGFVSKNEDGGDPYKWEPGLPKQVSVDAGNDEQADRENLKLGTTSKTIIAQKRGWHQRDIAKHRIEETKQLLEDAKAIADEFPWVSPDKVLEMLEQRGSNPVAQTPAPAPEPEEPEKPAKK